PDRFERARQVPGVEPLHELLVQALERGSQLLIRLSGRHAPVAVAGDHGRRPRDEVAEVVAELTLVALVQRVDRGAAVLAERHRAQRPKPDRVRAVDVDQVERVNHVPERLRDLAIIEQQEAVDEQLLRHLVAGREQERWPEDAVETKNVLAEQVVGVRPELLAQVLPVSRVRQRAQVVDQGVYLDIRDLPFVPGDRYAPRLAGTADAEVLQAALDEAAFLVVAVARQDEI